MTLLGFRQNNNRILVKLVKYLNFKNIRGNWPINPGKLVTHKGIKIRLVLHFSITINARKQCLHNFEEKSLWLKILYQVVINLQEQDIFKQAITSITYYSQILTEKLM